MCQMIYNNDLNFWINPILRLRMVTINNGGHSWRYFPNCCVLSCSLLRNMPYIHIGQYEMTCYNGN